MEQQSKAPQDIRNVVNFLRSSSAGMKIRVGVLNGKRVDYFKGASLLGLSTIQGHVSNLSRYVIQARAR